MVSLVVWEELGKLRIDLRSTIGCVEFCAPLVTGRSTVKPTNKGVESEQGLKEGWKTVVDTSKRWLSHGIVTTAGGP